MRFSKGKTFIAPSRIFKSDLSLFFPNIRGQTLLEDKTIKDTTPVFENKVSVVTVFNTQWAQNQVETFVSEKNNPELHKVIKSSGGIAQMVQLNVEENWMKAMIIKFFMPSLRKRMAKSDWGRYFLVRRGFTQEMQEAIGLLNTKVGYTYLVDGKCRIRWAGSGPCEGDEKEGIVRAIRRLIEESREATSGVKKKPTVMAPPSKTSVLKSKKKAAVSSL